MMEVTIAELEAYLLDNYGNGGIDQSLFMKLVEEIGEVAEVLNKKAGRKKSDGEDLQSQLGNELADVIHYAGLLYTSPSPRAWQKSGTPASA